MGRQNEWQWIEGLVRCQKYFPKNRHNYLPHAVTRISYCVKENPTPTPTHIVCGKGVGFTPLLVPIIQLLVEWVLQLQSRTKDWHLSWPWSIHSHIAVLWDGTRCRISFPLLHPAVTCLRGTHSTFGLPVAPTLISDTNLDHVMSEAIIIATGRPPVF